MSKIKNKQLIKLAMGLVMIGFTFIPFISMAQPGPCPGPETECPIDGGISLLLAAGLGYGVKRYRDARKKDKAATV